jgi:integral membrane sensor domain MASE1
MTTLREEIKEILQRSIASGQTISDPAGLPESAPDDAKSSRGPLRFVHSALMIACLGIVYFVAAKLGLKLAWVYPSASSVWPGTGIALATILLLGYRVWPGIFLGAFVAHLTTVDSLATSLGIASGNTLEGFIGAHFLNCFANGRSAFNRASDVLKFAFLAAMVSTVISATIGVTSLSMEGFIQPQDFGRVWFTWWLGDTIGSILLTPVLVLWSVNPRVEWNLSQLF